MKFIIKINILAALFFPCIGINAQGSSLSSSVGSDKSTLSMVIGDAGIDARLSSSDMPGFVKGSYVWNATIDGQAYDKLKQVQINKSKKNILCIVGKLGPLNVEQRFSPLENGNGFSEVISLHNPTSKPVVLDDIRTGFSRHINLDADPYRLVAVPYRRQADGSLHDHSMKDVANKIKGAGKLNPTCEPAWMPKAQLVDEVYRRMRSESWILTDGDHGLLVLKYNNDAIEHSAVTWDDTKKNLIFGGCAYVLHKEPVQANKIEPGETFSFGQTCYEFYDGGWPEGYAHYKSFINRQGHALTDEYQPQVQWNALFDLGDQRWSRDSILEQAALAKEVGCTRMYLDPGWEKAVSSTNPAPLYGSALWDQKRLGSIDEFVQLMKNDYGLELGFWAASRVYGDSQWPREFFRKTAVLTKKVPRHYQGRVNLALLAEAKASASSVFGGGNYPAHQIKNLNDGLYGNQTSWIAGVMPAWVEIDLGGQHTVSMICLSNDNTSKYKDRGASSFRILVTASSSSDVPEDEWQTVVEYSQYGNPLQKKMSFSFDPVATRKIRIELQESKPECVRIDEVEIYEALASSSASEENSNSDDAVTLQTSKELCMAHEQWQEERCSRLLDLAKAGVKFIMFDFHGWNGPCYAPDHGHSVPSTTMEHVDSIYGISKKIRQDFPDLRTEMHDAIWPWGCRYLPSYFHQGLKSGDYDENWAYEFMWNTIEDIRSKKALSLYYYNLAYDIPMYLHINMRADNENCLAFWWMASTVRHLGFGGLTNAARMEFHGALKSLSLEQGQQRFDDYKNAMATYNRLKRYFTHGEFSGIDGDETLHLHTLPDRPGGVLMVFNLSNNPVKRTLRIPLRKLNLKSSQLPSILGATGSIVDGNLLIKVELLPESPAIIEIQAQSSHRN